MIRIHRVLGTLPLLAAATLLHAQEGATPVVGAAVRVDPKVTQMAEDCGRSDQDCMRHFDRYERSTKEHSDQGGFTLFGANGNGLAFWGVGQELNYTEVDGQARGADAIEYQVGIGYIIFAKQRDAKISLALTSGLIPKGDLSTGGTRFSASIIGVAPEDATDCTTGNKQGAAALLCALDMQPTVTQGYFEESAGKLAIAYDNWRNAALERPAAGAKGSICPQVINYRYKQPRLDQQHRPVEPSLAEAIPEVLAINSALREKACHNLRPNARISFKSGTPDDLKKITGSLDLTFGDTPAKADKTNLGQGYYRNQIYLADTTKRDPQYYLPGDQSAEFTMSGLSDSAGLPSILASIVTYMHTDLAQKLHLLLRCSGGAPHAGGADNPVTNPVAFAKLVDNVRTSVDTPHLPGAPCYNN